MNMERACSRGDHMTYESTSGSHCQWRTGYEASLHAVIDLKHPLI